MIISILQMGKPRLSNLLKIAQLVSGEAEIHTRASGWRVPAVESHHTASDGTCCHITSFSLYLLPVDILHSGIHLSIICPPL